MSITKIKNLPTRPLSVVQASGRQQSQSSNGGDLSKLIRKLPGLPSTIACAFEWTKITPEIIRKQLQRILTERGCLGSDGQIISGQESKLPLAILAAIQQGYKEATRGMEIPIFAIQEQLLETGLFSNETIENLVLEREELLLNYGIYSQEELGQVKELSTKFRRGQPVSGPDRLLVFHYLQLSYSGDRASQIELGDVSSAVHDDAEGGFRYVGVYVGYKWRVPYSGKINEQQIVTPQGIVTVADYFCLKPGEVFVDIGAGVGHDALYLADRHTESRIISVEANVENILAMLETLQNRPGLSNLTVRLEDYCACPSIRRRQFDKALVKNTNSCSSQAEDSRLMIKLFEEIKAGGRIVVQGLSQATSGYRQRLMDMATQANIEISINSYETLQANFPLMVIDVVLVTDGL